MKTSITHNGEEYTIECLENSGDIKGLEADWIRLEKECPEPYTYFQSFDWCLNWCKVYVGNGTSSTAKRPQVFVVRQEGEAVLIWPLMISRRCLGVTVLTSLSEPVGQYSHVIYDADSVDADLSEKIWQVIRDSVDVDAVTMNRFSPDSLLAKSIGQEGVKEQSELYAAVLDLDRFSCWDGYLSSLTSKQRKERKRRRKKIQKVGELAYRIHYGGSEQYSTLVRLAVDWKLEWLRHTGRRESVLSSSFFRDFLLNLSGEDTDGSFPEGALIGVLMLDDEPVAIEIGACLSGHYYSFLGAFNWQYKHVSPGKIQIEEHQKWAKSVGIRKFDFLGDPADYKGSLTTSFEELECRSFPKSALGYVYCAVWKARLRPRLKRAFHQLRGQTRVNLLELLNSMKNRIFVTRSF